MTTVEGLHGLDLCDDDTKGKETKAKKEVRTMTTTPHTYVLAENRHVKDEVVQVKTCVRSGSRRCDRTTRIHWRTLVVVDDNLVQQVNSDVPKK